MGGGGIVREVMGGEEGVMRVVMVALGEVVMGGGGVVRR